MKRSYSLAARVAAVCILAGATLVNPVALQRRGPGVSRQLTTVNGRAAAAGEVLVKFRRELASAERGQVEQQTDADENHTIGGTGVRRIHSRRFDTAALLAFLQSHPDVAYAEPNYIIQSDAVPNDMFFSQMWGLLNHGQVVGVAGTPGADIGATLAWDVSTGSRATVVAVTDTGIDYGHPDLAANVWSAPAAFTVNINGQTIPCAAGTHGFNVIAKTCDPWDDNGHGTHVSGTIGAQGNNGIGVAGVNWTTSIMASKFLDSNGTGTLADSINAIEFVIQAAAATGANVRVLNNSWSSGGPSQALLDEINKAGAHNMLFVVSAGNDGNNIDAVGKQNYPASYAVEHPELEPPHVPSLSGFAANVIAVASTDNKDTLAVDSNYGPASVHLAAPGVNIVSTYFDSAGNDWYQYLTGTSMAAPHVTGAAALVLSRCNLTTAALKADLLATVDPLALLTGRLVSGGRLNVNTALRACIPDFSLTASPLTQTNTAGASTSYTVTVAPVRGFTGTVAFSVSGLPAAATASFVPTSVTTSGSTTMTVTSSASTPAGSYSLTVTGTSGSLSHTVSGVTLTIGGLASTTAVTTSNTPSTFGSPVTLTATVTGSGAPTGTATFMDGLTTLGSASLDAGGRATLTTSSLATGTHAITAVYVGDAIFSGSTSAPLSQVVTAAVLTVTADNQTRAYGAANPTLTASYSGFKNGDTLTTAGVTGSPTLTTTAAPASAVGGYPITAAAGTLAATNYTFAFASGTLTVTKASLTVTAADVSRGYGDPNPTFTASYTGFKNGETLVTSGVTGSPSLTTAATVSSPVGGYPITSAQGTLIAANYTFTFANGTLTVNKATLTATAAGASRGYGDANPTFTASYSGFKNGETLATSGVTGAPSLTTTATSASGAGSYTITATPGTLAAVNYTLAFVNGTLIVNKATLTVSADAASRAYGTANPALTTSYSGFKNGETLATSGVAGAPSLTTTATPASAVGSYAITAAPGTLAAANYTFSFAAGTLTVTKGSLTVTATNQTKAYGAANPALTVSYSGFVNGDTAASLTTPATASTLATTASAPGTYAITASGATSANYTFTYVNGTLTVTAATLTVTANNQTKVYGAANPALTVSYSGFVNGDTAASLTTPATASTTATAASTPGTYAITPSGATSANYTFTYVNGTLTVTAATLTVTATNQTKAYGAANPALTVSYSGFVNGDTAAILTTPATASTLATTASAPGTYAITASGATSANYTFTYVNGTLTVTAATLTVTATNQTKAYGAANPALTVTYSGFVNGDTAAILTTPATASTTATTASTPGTYAITASGATSTNYTFTYVNGTLTVTAATLTVTATNQTKAYGAANPALTVSYSGFVNGDTAASLTTPATASTLATAASAPGTYAITPSGATSANYTFSYVNGALTVTAATLTVTANNQTRPYGAANPALTVAYSGFVNGETLATSGVTGAPNLSTTATPASAVGGYAITAAPGTLAAANYTFVFAGGTLTVTKGSLTVTATNQTKAYGAANPALTVSYSGFVNGDTAASLTTPATASTLATTASTPGTYAITASGATSANYTFTYVNGTLTVTAATLTVTATNQTKAYGAANPALTVSYSGFVNGDTAAILTTPATASTLATTASAPGTYAITASGATSANYTFSYVNGTLTVTAAPLTVMATNQTKVYGAANPALTVSYSGFVNGDTAASLTTPATASTTATTASTPGTYAITASGATSANYTFTYVNGTLTVTAATLTVTATNQTKAYGAANPALTVSYSGFVNGDTAASLTTPATASTLATTASAPGTYAITASGATSANYTFTYVNGTLTVTAATLTVTATNQTKAYGAANPALTVSYSGFVNGDTAAILTTPATASTLATTASAPGTYAITASGATSANYTFTYVNGTLTVTAATLTVTATNQTKAYGAANPALTVSYSGFVNGDTAAILTTPATASTLATTASAPGTYAITASGATSANYTFTYVNGTLTVTAATLTVTATNQTKTYGAANPALAVSYSGFVNGDTAAILTTPATASTLATAASAPGTYAITASGATSANYTFSYVNGTLTVTAATLTVTATNQTKTYGAANPALTVSYSGFVNGDTAAILTTPATASTTATAASAPGTYAITASGATSANYTFTYVNGALTVTAATLTVTATNQTKVYGAANPALTVTYSGFVNGDTAASLTTPATASTTATTASAPGTYAITASGATSANYTFTYVNGTLTVTAATLTVTATNQTKAYGAANPALTVSYSGFVNGDTAAILTTPATASTTATTASAPGTYAITASGATSANYTFTYVNGTLTVTAATLTVTATNQTKVYGAANPALTVSYSGFVNGDTAAILTTPATASTTATTASAPGTYAITASGATSANYTFSYVNGTLTVTAATLTVTATNQTKAYGVANPALTVSYSGFVNGDTAAILTTPATASTTATAASAPGTYAITASGATSANYTFSYVNGTLTVTAATLTVTATNQTKVYGMANPALTVSYSGFVNGDTAASLTTPATASTLATAASAPGTYAITASGAVSTSYAFTYVPGTLTVVANTAPSFTKGADQAVFEDGGPQTFAGWATAMSAGSEPGEATQLLNFIVGNSNNLLFAAPPAIAANGTLSFAPAPNANGFATVTVRLHDDGGTVGGGVDTSAPQTFTITLRAVNDAPSFTRGADQTVPEDAGSQTVPGWATAISAGPIDEAGQTLTFVTSSTNSALFSAQPTVSAGGTLAYSPAPGAFGSATVSVQLRDDGGTANGGVDASAIQTFTINVTAVNRAPVAASQSVAATEDTPAPITLTASDVDSPTLTYHIVDGPSHGTLTGPPPNVTYLPAPNFNGTDSFTFRASDGSLESNLATVTIAVAAVNDAPVAVNDSYSTNEDTPLTVAAPGVLANDSDVDSTTLTAGLVSGPTHGTVTLQADGSFTYTPAANVNGTDSFTYTVSDGSLESAPATVTIAIRAVSDTPVSVADQYLTLEDVALTVAAPGVLGNDIDVDGTTLSAALVSGPAHGTLTLQADGSFTYTPAANFNGTDGFSYTARDGSLESTVATVTLTVTAVSDTPVATDDTYATNEDGVLSLAAPGVLANDLDVDGTPVSAVLVSGPAHGALTLQADGSFTYTPTANFNGTDRFTYKASAGSLESAEATVTILVAAVNDAPVAADDRYSTNQETLLTVAAPGVLANDTDVDSATLTAVLVTGPAHGTLSLNANGSFTYSPAANYSGADRFTYTANDGSLDSNVATVTLTIDAVNQAPVAVSDSYGTDEDTPLTIVAPGVLANDTDSDSPTLTAVLVASVAHGTLTLNANGSFTYTPAPNYNGADSFTYKASDGSLASNIATVVIAVAAVNDAPVAVNDSYSTNGDTPLTVAAPGVLANDTDIDSPNLTAVLVGGPAHGTLILSANGSFTYTPTPSYSGADSFSYTANDGSLNSAIATVTIAIAAVNHAPVANDQAVVTDEDTAKTIVLVATDPEGSPLTYSIATPPSHGTLTGAPPTVTYLPAPNYNGADSFTFKARDGSLWSNLATVTIAVAAVNDAPVAANDSYSTNEDTPLTVAAPGVLGNDSDVDSATLTAALAAGPSHGTVALQADGSFTYTPAANVNGIDSFSYTVSDGSLQSAPATVTIAIHAVNDAPLAVADQYLTLEDVALTVAAPGVLANDTDVDSTTLHAVLATGPAHGALALQADGSFTYTPAANFNGTDSFTYTATDGSLESSAATVTIAVTAVNDAPVASDDTYGTNEDGILGVAAPGVLTNDLDADGPTLSAVLGSGPAHGTVTLLADGSFTYTPAANFNGTDHFTYKASDGSLESAAATVTILVAAVNDAPVAVNDAYSATEDTPLTIATPGVLANDTDVDSATLTAVLVTGPAHGTLILSANGSFTYTPAPNYNGADSFTYTANDGSLNSNVAIVAIAVAAVNDAPVAVNDSYGTSEDTTLTIAAPGVLANDSDSDSATLTAVLVAGPAHGTLTLNANGSFVYAPAPNYNGADSFTYTANDGSLNSSVATVTIAIAAVNDPPVAANDTYGAIEDTPLSVAPPGVLTNDTDVDSATLTAVLVSGPAHGTLILNTNGSFTYIPAPNYNGADSFSYMANDGSLNSNVAIVAIAVAPVNDAPVAANDSYTTNEDTPLSIVAPGVLANDSDPDSPTITAVLVGAPTHGALILQADGSFTYTPAANYNGGDSFTYKANDGSADSNVATVTIAIAAVNDAPVASDQAVITDEDQAKTFTLAAADVEGSSLTYAIVTPPSHGVLSGTMPTLTYTPAANYNGADDFTFKANDGDLDSNIAAVAITIRPVNDAPVAVDDSYTTSEDVPLTVAAPGVLGNDSDIDSASSPGGSVFLGWDQNPQPDLKGYFVYYGTAPGTYVNRVDVGNTTATAVSALSAGQQYYFAVTAYDSVGSESPSSNEVAATATAFGGAESATITAVLVAAPAHGMLTLNADGSFTYAPAANYSGLDRFTYKANDGSLDSNVATVSITVGAVNDAPLANDQSVAAVEDIPVPITLTASDIDSPVLTYAIVAGPSHGTLAGTPPTVTYAPAPNYNGTDSFTFKANDGSLDSNTATVSLSVAAVNDAPSFTKGANQTVLEGAGAQTVTGWATSLSAGPADESGQTLNFIVGNSNSALFSAQPVVSATGTLTYTAAAGAAGTATVTVQLHDNGGVANGGVDTSAPQTFTITVNARVTPAITVSGGTFTYDGTAHAATATATDGAAQVSGTFSFTYAPGGSAAPTSAGTYTVTATFVSSDPNYLNATGTGTVTIARAALTVTATNASKVYGNPNPAFNASYAGFVNGETTAALGGTLSLATSATISSPVGTYPITAAGLTSVNYTITYVAGSFSITKAAATVTAGGGTKVYGASDPALSAATQIGFTAADAATITLTSARAAGEAVGSYVTTATASGGAVSNYTVTYVAGTFNITKAAATVTAGGGTKVYGASDPALSAATQTGFTAVDAATITLTSARAAGEAVGSYVTTATASGAALGNYTVTYVAGTFTIAKKAATVTAGGGTKVAGAADPPLSPTTQTGFTTADAATITLTSTRAAGEAVGSYVTTAMASGAALGNYTVTYVPGTFTITAATGGNHAPVAANDSYTTNQSTALTVAAPGVLGNDTDVDAGDTRVAVLAVAPTHGVLILAANGSFRYTPSGTFTGTDTFKYQAKDAAGALSNVATVTITVSGFGASLVLPVTITPVNGSGFATNDSSTTHRTTVFTLGATGARADDTDVDIDPLVAVVAEARPASESSSSRSPQRSRFEPVHGGALTRPVALRRS